MAGQYGSGNIPLEPTEGNTFGRAFVETIDADDANDYFALNCINSYHPSPALYADYEDKKCFFIHSAIWQYYRG